MPFIGKADGDAIVAERPQFLDQTVIELARPLAPKKCDDLLAAGEELTPVAPSARRVVSERNPLRIARIPRILNQADFLNCRFESKGRERRPPLRFDRLHDWSLPSTSFRATC